MTHETEHTLIAVFEDTNGERLELGWEQFFLAETLYAATLGAGMELVGFMTDDPDAFFAAESVVLIYTNEANEDFVTTLPEILQHGVPVDTEYDEEPELVDWRLVYSTV